MHKNTRADAAEDVVYIEKMRGNTEREIEIQYLPVLEAMQTVIQKAAEADATLRELKTTIRQGWPASMAEVSENVKDYFLFREELSLQNGFKGVYAEPEKKSIGQE